MVAISLRSWSMQLCLASFWICPVVASPNAFLSKVVTEQPRCHGRFDGTYPEFLTYCSNFTRYCEILQFSFGWSGVQAHIWNTIGCSTCPEELWENLSVPATMVKNGPRYWLVDSVQRSAPPTESIDPTNGSYILRTFGGIPTKLIGTIHLSFGEVMTMQQQTPYEAYPIHRGTVFHFGAGRQVYELVTSNNDVYVLLSMSDEKDSNMTDASLFTLGQRLNDLPTGWSYRCRVLVQPMRDQGANGTAYVLNDEFLNMYMNVVNVDQSIFSDAPCIEETPDFRINYCAAEGIKNLVKNF